MYYKDQMIFHTYNSDPKQKIVVSFATNNKYNVQYTNVHVMFDGFKSKNITYFIKISDE